MKPKKEMYHSLNLLKAIAIYFVLFYHDFFANFNILESKDFSVYCNYFLRTILSCCVPLFFFVNGALLLNKKLDIRKHIIKIFKIVIITVLWAIITIILSMFIKQEFLTPKEILSIIWHWKAGWVNHLWFLQAVVVIYTFLPLIKGAYDKEKSYFYFFFVMVMVLTFGNIFLSMVINVFEFVIHKNYLHQINFNFFNGFNAFRGIYGYSLGYFMIGGLCFANKERFMSKKMRIACFCIPISMLGLMIYGLIISTSENKAFDVVWDGYDSIFTLINVLAIFILSLLYKGKGKIENIITLIGQNSLGIYFVHVFLGAIFRPLYTQFVFSDNIIVNAIYILVILLLSLGFCLIMKKIPVIKKLFSI